MKLDHIALIVSKSENIEFYEKFGFQEVKRIRRSYDTVIFMECDGITLEIFVDPRHPARVSEPEAMGLRHLAFTVDDFDGTCAQFDVEDVRTDFFGTRFTFTKDPDGQPVEIKEGGQI